ncbi:MAG: efflux RND transporter periplasmic adaptor subunit [Oscillospiraceae bacterium]|nr:efflux RND transporter periplasmic adaptor subunit [Oscillospiraceae bacterium]
MHKTFVLSLLVLIAIYIHLIFSIKNIKPVKASMLNEKEYTNYITVSGEFENQNKTEIKLSYPVIVDKVYVKQNQFVNKGQLLFSIDLQQIENSLNGKIDSDLIQQFDYDNIAAMSAASSYTNISEIQREIYAPSAGYISELNIFPGAAVIQNKTILTINETDDILAKFTISQLDFGKISVGDNVNIYPVAFSDIIYSGKIIEKNAIVKKQISVTGNKVVVDVFAEISNPDSRVAGGLQINGKIQNEESRNIKTLDYDFIFQDDTGEYVYIFNKGKAEKIYIETGIEAETYAEIITKFPEKTIFLSGEMKDGNSVIIAE